MSKYLHVPRLINECKKQTFIVCRKEILVCSISDPLQKKKRNFPLVLGQKGRKCFGVLGNPEADFTLGVIHVHWRI